jgi:hypothetical protein
MIGAAPPEMRGDAPPPVIVMLKGLVADLCGKEKGATSSSIKPTSRLLLKTLFIK